MVTGGVVLYRCGKHEAEHERAVHVELARRLAGLLGRQFLGEYSSSARYDAGLYFVPTDTVVGVENARQMGIRGEGDLFGGVVPQAFVATKSITHPLIRRGARAVKGWSAGFSQRLGGAVLAGFTAFTMADAHQAGMRLLVHGPVQVKEVLANAGRGQWVIATADELADVLAGLDEGEIARVGLVLEEHLEEVSTYSVGQVRVGELMASYYGTQRLTEDNTGAIVYGGSDLVVTRGGFDALLRLDLPGAMQLAVRQAEVYDAAASVCFPGLLVSRRNYDVIAGVDAQGRRRSGVLEQSWRIGGASSAEIAALEALGAAPGRQVAYASSFEAYGSKPEVPPGVTPLFSGLDPEVGLITKFVMVEADGCD